MLLKRAVVTLSLPTLALAVPAAAPQATPSPLEILRRADAILSPAEFESELTMTSHRGGGQSRTITMRIWKKGMKRLRVRMLTPPDDAGQEVLRDGDNHWNYIPNLKRALRISPKQEFHGGDFNNTDILRVNLAEDYTVKLLEYNHPEEYLLELRARNESVSYDIVRYFVRKRDFMPLRQEFYTKSAKLIRKLDMKEPKAYDKHVRPSLLLMQNMLAPARHTEMIVNQFVVKKDLSEELFQLASLGR